MRFKQFLNEKIYDKTAEQIISVLSKKHDKTDILKKLQVELSRVKNDPIKFKEISRAIQIILRNKKPMGKSIEDFKKKFGFKIENNGCNISNETIQYLDDTFSFLKTKSIEFPKTLVFAKDSKEFSYKKTKYNIESGSIAAFGMAKTSRKREPILIFNNDALKIDELKTTFEELNSGHWFSSSDIRHVIVHEIAHYFHYMRCPTYEDFLDQAEGEFPHKDVEEWIQYVRDNVSGYAAESNGEFYAEVFAAGVLGRKHFPKRIIKYFNHMNKPQV